MNERIEIPQMSSEPSFQKRAGTIKIGEKVPGTTKTGKEYERPVATDYFIMHSDNPDFEKAFKKLYGDEPKSIKIAFASNQQEQFCTNYMRRYTSSDGLACMGNNDKAKVRNDLNEWQLTDCPCQHAQPDSKNRINCHQVVTLDFLLPEIDVLNTFRFSTKSFYTRENLFSTIQNLMAMTTNKPMHIVLDMTVELKEKQVNKQKKIYPVVSLYIPDLTISRLQKIETLSIAQRLGFFLGVEPEKVMIEAPVDEPVGAEIIDQGTGEIVNAVISLDDRLQAIFEADRIDYDMLRFLLDNVVGSNVEVMAVDICSRIEANPDYKIVNFEQSKELTALKKAHLKEYQKMLASENVKHWLYLTEERASIVIKNLRSMNQQNELEV
ncbi:MAG: hypothetical protein DRQ46_00575 [Gammaproteobacteria bacterium]|nr:MAG: hypothetical protein DRQ46_00575 [Gammaproteobacteria bacterium]